MNSAGTAIPAEQAQEECLPEKSLSKHGDLKYKLQHWRAFPAKNDWKCAPMLEFQLGACSFRGISQTRYVKSV